MFHVMAWEKWKISNMFWRHNPSYTPCLSVCACQPVRLSVTCWDILRRDTMLLCSPFTIHTASRIYMWHDCYSDSRLCLLRIFIYMWQHCNIWQLIRYVPLFLARNFVCLSVFARQTNLPVKLSILNEWEQHWSKKESHWESICCKLHVTTSYTLNEYIDLLPPLSMRLWLNTTRFCGL